MGDMDTEDHRAWLSLIMRCVAPLGMVLAGLLQTRNAIVSPRAACDLLPPSKLNGVRSLVAALLIMFPVAAATDHALEDTLTWRNGVQYGLEFLAWSFVLYIQVLELRRFVTMPYILSVFALVEALALVEQLYATVTNYLDGHQTMDEFLMVVLQYPVNIIMAVISLRRFPRPESGGLWWTNASSYQLSQYPISSFSPSTSGLLDKKGARHSDSFDSMMPSKAITSSDSECPKESTKKKELNTRLLVNGDPPGEFPIPTTPGPLSVFIHHFDVAGSDERGWGLNDLWGRSYYCIFTVHVKWDKRTIWDVKRRYSDFKLLRHVLTAAGLFKKFEFTHGFPHSPGVVACLCGCRDHRFEYQSVMRTVKGLSSFMQDVLTSPAAKSHPLFRAFCCHGRTLQAGEKFNDKLSIYDFQLLNLIGKGSYGKVMQARKKDSGKIYAIKVLKKADLKKVSQIKHTKTERHILGNVVHPFICSLRYAFQDNTKLFMVLDYFNGGELFFHLNKGKFPESRTKFYIAEICLALEHLHVNNIVYRDLKPENILLDSEGHIKLTDFGLSRKFKKGESAEAKTFCGTPQYLAPEILKGNGYSYGVDWWAMGALTYELLTRVPPFQERDPKLLYQLILNAPVNYPTTISPVAKTFCAALLEKNPTKRLGCYGAEEIKAHPFFDGIDWKALKEKKLQVPFVPENTTGTGLEDTTNVWPEFKSEKVKDTLIDPAPLDSLEDERKFSQFTYADPETYATYARKSSLAGAGEDLLRRGSRILSSARAHNKEVAIQLEESDAEGEFPRKAGGKQPH